MLTIKINTKEEGRKMFKKFIIFKLSIALPIALFFTFTSCENADSGTDYGVSVKLNLGSISDSYRATGAIAPQAAAALGEGGCTLDGLRLWVKNIDVRDESQWFPIWVSPDWDEGTMVDLRSTGDISTLTEDVNIPVGTYVGILIYFIDKFQVKAKTKIGSNWYYTTATGIIKDSAVDPEKYDFYSYPFIYPDGDPYDNNTVWTHCDVPIPESFTIDNTADYQLDILIDLIHLVYFWNGEGTPTIAPFTWIDPSIHNIEDYWKTGQPHFGVRYIPIAMAITDINDPSADITMETYGVYPESKGDISDDTAQDLTVITIAYQNSTTKVPYFAKLRNCDNDLTALQQFFSDFQLNESENGFNCKNFAHDPVFGYHLIKDFPRLSPGQKSTFTADVYDENEQFQYVSNYIVKRLK
jgi:hypothetical protein